VLNTFLFIKNPPAEPVTEAKNYLPARMIYRNWNVIKVGLIYGITGMTFIIQSMFIMSFMLESGINQQLAGQLVALNGILSIFSSLIWGGLSDRLGRKNALIAAMGFNLLSTVIPVIFLNSIGFTINLVLQGLVATGVFTLVQTLSTEQVPAQATSVAYSYVTFIFAIGQFIGPTIAGWLIDFGNFKSVFLFSSIFIAAALYLAKKVPSDKPAEPALSPDLNH
ncbi:MAG TPA: MFS transporter, partial [Chondromyces sp.]|nr:MFS transporter [Chondromyces sp.]